jgi:hypothetical protein
LTDPRDQTPPGARATPADLARHALRVAREEYANALGTISLGGVARFWHPDTGLVLCCEVAELRAFFAVTKQRL